MVLKEVEFHTGVADPVGFACRLLRKAHRQGLRVQVTAPAATLAALDRELWTFEEREFLPHVRVPGAAAAVAERTPIWLSPQAGGEGAPRVLVNLDAQAPTELAPLERLIEIVASDADQADRGRSRWRAYKAAGLEITHHAAGGVRG
ncbi:MAG: DNA polymerase III subunit chi [Rubrivivax sp.]|nr:DNA polymerase III subunit chi [Rubrivivax sp.]